MLDIEPDLEWRIVGTADFNGDGKPDILWRHSATGAVRIWYMDGLLRTGAVGLVQSQQNLLRSDRQAGQPIGIDPRRLQSTEFDLQVAQPRL